MVGITGSRQPGLGAYCNGVLFEEKGALCYYKGTTEGDLHVFLKGYRGTEQRARPINVG